MPKVYSRDLILHCSIFGLILEKLFPCACRVCLMIIPKMWDLVIPDWLLWVVLSQNTIWERKSINPKLTLLYQTQPTFEKGTAALEKMTCVRMTWQPDWYGAMDKLQGSESLISTPWKTCVWQTSQSSSTDSGASMGGTDWRVGWNPTEWFSELVLVHEEDTYFQNQWR